MMIEQIKPTVLSVFRGEKNHLGKVIPKRRVPRPFRWPIATRTRPRRSPTRRLPRTPRTPRPGRAGA